MVTKVYISCRLVGLKFTGSMDKRITREIVVQLVSIGTNDYLLTNVEGYCHLY